MCISVCVVCVHVHIYMYVHMYGVPEHQFYKTVPAGPVLLQQTTVSAKQQKVGYTS